MGIIEVFYFFRIIGDNGKKRLRIKVLIKVFKVRCIC